MKLYLAGPMRGIPEFNFPAFHAGASRLREIGHIVFSPAERDIAVTGVDISKGNATGDNALAEAQHGFNLREALKDDLEFICLEADGIALLPGWQNSKGAIAERATALALGLLVMTIDEALLTIG
jgi:hypothetical protein